MNGAKYMLYHHDCETSFNLTTYTMSRLIRPDSSAGTTDSQTDTESAPTCYGPSSDAPNKEYFMNRINEGSLTSQATAGAEYNIHHTTHSKKESVYERICRIVPPGEYAFNQDLDTYWTQNEGLQKIMGYSWTLPSCLSLVAPVIN